MSSLAGRMQEYRRPVLAGELPGLYGQGVQNRMEGLSSAVSTTLLEVSARPELLYSQVLANLMTPSLWRLRDNGIAVGSSTVKRYGDGTVMGNIHQYTHDRIHHMSDKEVIDYWGWDNLTGDRRRLGRGKVDYALRNIYEGNKRLGDKEGLRLMDTEVYPKNRFMRYRNNTYDVMMAHSRRRGDNRGEGQCADIVALTAALACAVGDVPLDKMVILGSPFHYRLFVNQGSGFWFSSKWWFDHKRFRKRFTTQGKRQKAIDESVMDRVITPFGVYMLDENTSTMPRSRVTEVINKVDSFLGLELRQFRDAGGRNIIYRDKAQEGYPAIDLSEVENAEGVEKRVRELAGKNPGSPYEYALYMFRSMNVDHPEAYVKAALRDYNTMQEATKVKTVSDAVKRVQGIKGDESIFRTDDRISLPDEVLLFNTGTHRDKAILLYSLIYHTPRIPRGRKNGMEILFTDQTSYVHVGGAYIDTKTFLIQTQPLGNVTHIFNEKKCIR